MPKPWEIAAQKAQIGGLESSTLKPWEKAAQSDLEKRTPLVPVGNIERRNPTLLQDIGTIVDYPGRVGRTAVAAPLSKEYSFKDVLTQLFSNPISPPKEKAPSVEKLTSEVVTLPSTSGEKVPLMNALLGPKPEEHPILKGAINTGVGMATDLTTYSGPLLKLAGVGAAKGVEAVGGAAERMAQRQAVKSLGRMTPTETTTLGRAGAQDLGKTLIEENIITKVPATKSKILERVIAKQKESGEKIGEIVNTLGSSDTILSSKGYPIKQINKEDIVSKIVKESDLPFDDPGFQKQSEGIFNNFLNTGGQDVKLDLVQAQKLRTRYGKKINWKNVKMGNPSDRDLIYLPIYEGLGDSIIDSAKSIQEVIKDPAAKALIGNKSQLAEVAADEMLASRDVYSKMKKALPVVKKAANTPNDYISLKDLLFGSLGAAAFGPKGVALVAGNKLARAFGSQALSTAGRTVSAAAKPTANIIRGATGSKLSAPLISFLNSLNQNRGQ